MARQNNPTPTELVTSPHVAHAVIAAWLNGSPASDAPFLRPEHFPDDRDKAIWGAILELEAGGVTADYTALVERLKRTRTVDHTDWPEYCMAIRNAGQLSSSMSMGTHANTVYENYRRLQIYRELMQKVRRVTNLTIPLSETEAAKPETKELWTAAELLETQFAEPRGLWPGVIPMGLTVIGARPKYGKSLLMLQVSAAVGTGGRLFDQQVEQRPVLYYALEDSPRRLKERLSRLAIAHTARLSFARQIKPLHLGGLADVDAKARDYGLIIIDTISRAVPGQDFNREAALFGDLLGRLQTVAMEHDMAIVAVVHTRKPNGMDHDPVDDVLGSTQMTAAADCVLAIYREQQQSRLRGRGRDLEDIDLTMEFDPSTVCWQLVGKTSEVSRSEYETEILDVLTELGRAKTADVAKALGKDVRNTRRRLTALWMLGKCKRDLADGVSFYYLDNSDEGMQGREDKPIYDLRF